jgi:hypothetical protein
MLEAGPVQDLEGAIAQLQKKKRRKQNPSM